MGLLLARVGVSLWSATVLEPSTQSTSFDFWDFFSTIFFLIYIADLNLNVHSRYMKCAQTVVKLDVELNS